MKYDKSDLMELFLAESESLTGNIDDGKISYKTSKDDFLLEVFILTYENKINVFLTYKETDIFGETFYNVTELKKEDVHLKILRGKNIVASISFRKMFVISVENE